MNYSQQDIELRTVPPKPEGTPRWLVEDYEGAEQDIADDIFAATYWDEYAKAEQQAITNDSVLDPNDVLARTQVIVESMGRASIHAYTLKGNMGRAFDMLVYRMKTNGFHRAIKGEYETVQEWLLDKIPGLDNDSGELSNILFLQTTVIPTIEALGNGTAKRLMGMQEQWSKTRAGVPFLRDHARLLTGAEDAFEDAVKKINKSKTKLQDKARKEQDPEKRAELVKQIEEHDKLIEQQGKIRDAAVKAAAPMFKEAFIKFMNVVEDPKIPVNGPNGVAAVLKRGGELVIYQGEMCYPNEDEVTFTITLPKQYERAFQSMLRHLANFRMTDGKTMVAELGKKILKELGKGGA